MPLDEAPDWRTKRREVILAAADALFAGRTYGEVQMEEVARKAGVGKATLYRYFPSKEELYLESLDRAMDRLVTDLSALPEDGGPADRLAAMIRALLRTLDEQLPTLKLLGGDQSDLAERGRQILRRRSAQVAQALRGVLEAGVAGGAFRPHDTQTAPLLIIGMVRGAIMMSGDLSRDMMETAILDLVLAGTAAPEGREELASSPPISSKPVEGLRFGSLS